MPELPEVETTCRGIAPHVLNQLVERVVVRQRQLRWPVPEQLQHLCGSRIEGVIRRAKYILLTSRRGTAIIHLGMSGSLRVTHCGAPVRKHDHVELIFAQQESLRLHDPRRFGAVLWTTQEPLQHPLLASLGPEPLSDDFDGERLLTLSRRRRLAIKNFIMNNSVVVGVGNIYANEALFLAGIRPTTAAGRIDRAHCHALAEAIKHVLSSAIDVGGSTLRDFVNPQGQPGYFQQFLSVYGRQGQPCRHCRTVIRHKAIGQRASFYCPSCQRS